MLTAPQTATLPLRAKLFRGFADPSRLAILESLREGEQTVGQIVTATSLGQPNASNHLACLLDCGLVRREQRGKHAIYALADERVAALLALADEVIADVAEGLYACTHYGRPASGR